ncbi:MAG: GNAT family N-acetyltransferase [Deltaproteobacteria bacterium]|nr:GNAT family N-acetyltransferase [Deltaproteobacteria bacterium]MBW2339051.1 GNAT family N-acetyltransferase [Deltaproteobacteria bacterium]
MWLFVSIRGWTDTIGVDSSFQKKGVARLLIGEMLNYLKKVGVYRIYFCKLAGLGPFSVF